MREILFRGKTISDAKWCYGYYIRREDHHYIYPVESGFSMEIYPDTLGQFTGMLDAVGNKIFEGDYIELDSEVKNIFDISDGDVRYSRGGFFVGSYGNSLRSLNAVADYTGVMRGRVVGNIHDNPELTL